jgi:hypothetical protein
VPFLEETNNIIVSLRFIRLGETLKWGSMKRTMKQELWCVVLPMWSMDNLCYYYCIGHVHWRMRNESEDKSKLTSKK